MFVHSFIKKLSRDYISILVLLSLNKSSCTTTFVYEHPKPEIAKNEEIETIFACSRIKFLTLYGS